MEYLSHLLLDFAQREDSIFFVVLFASATTFLVAEAFWFWRKWRGVKRPASPTNASVPVDDPRFEIFWTLVPAFVLVLLVFAGGGRLTAKKANKNSPKVSSSQNYVR